VRDLNGEAVNGADVFLLREDGEPAAAPPDYLTKTNREGRFEFLGIAPGNYTLVGVPPSDTVPSQGEGMVRPKLAPASTAVVVGKETAEALLVLPLGVEVWIFPSCGEENFFELYAVRILDGQGVPLIDGLRPKKEVRFGGWGTSFWVPPGTLTAEVHCPGYKVGRAPFKAAPGVHVKVELIPE
jgi:hypothetical protein